MMADAYDLSTPITEKALEALQVDPSLQSMVHPTLLDSKRKSYRGAFCITFLEN